MTEEDSPTVSILEAHEEFIQHIEQGAAKIRAFAMVTIVVAALLAAGIAYQLVLPFATGQTVVSVNLADPALLLLEALLVALALAWLYIGARDYLLMSRLGRQIREARELEDELFRKAGIN